MKRVACLVLTATTVTTVTTATLPVRADASGPPAGNRCDWATVSDPTWEHWSGLMQGGPLAAPGSTISIRCSIHVGNNVHSGPAAFSLSAGPSDGVVVLPPTVISFFAPAADVVIGCDEATVDGTTWYWDGTGWSTDPESPCGDPYCEISPECLDRHGDSLPEPVRKQVWDPLFGYLQCSWSGRYCPVFDEMLCPALAVPYPPEGDVPGLWDCQPYD